MQSNLHKMTILIQQNPANKIALRVTIEWNPIHIPNLLTKHDVGALRCGIVFDRRVTLQYLQYNNEQFHTSIEMLGNILKHIKHEGAKF